MPGNNQAPMVPAQPGSCKYRRHSPLWTFALSIDGSCMIYGSTWKQRPPPTHEENPFAEALKLGCILGPKF